MTRFDETLKKEAELHDSVAQQIKIDIKKAQIFYAFDSPASYYADRLPRLKKTLLKTLGNPSGKRVLIYGCGNDSAATWFTKLGSNVDAIDISPKSILNQKLIAHLLNLDFNPMVMDAHNLALQSNCYDIIYGNAILHHLNLKRATNEIFRVLKKDGIAVFRDVMEGNIFIRAFRFATPFWRTPDEHPLTIRDLALLEQKFSKCRISHYILSGLPYHFFIRIMNNVLLKKFRIKLRITPKNFIYDLFDRIDEKLFRKVPSLKNKAWLCLVILEKR